MALSKTRILVVDDDPAVREGLNELLLSNGYAVLTAADGRTGLKKGREKRPDLVLLDVNLPHLNGFQVCRELREGGFTNPIIILTARRDDVDKILGLEIGAVDYVTKPFNPREVLARIRAHLRVSPQESGVGKRNGDRAQSRKGQRRLLSVMFSDMKDFSRIMNRDEDLALKMLRVYNTRVSAEVKRFSGRVIEIVGDAFLVAFESGLHAVRCSLAILRALERYNRSKAASEHLRIRIGLHVGDVTEIDGRLRGNTVNIAARLQQISQPDSVSLSEAVYESTRGTIRGQISKLGMRKLKNIRQPLCVYRVKLTPSHSPQRGTS